MLANHSKQVCSDGLPKLDKRGLVLQTGSGICYCLYPWEGVWTLFTRYWINKYPTSMHSSRMRTARLLPVSPSMHCGGGGVSAMQWGRHHPHSLWTDRYLWKHDLRKLRAVINCFYLLVQNATSGWNRHTMKSLVTTCLCYVGENAAIFLAETIKGNFLYISPDVWFFWKNVFIFCAAVIFENFILRYSTESFTTTSSVSERLSITQTSRCL